MTPQSDRDYWIETLTRIADPVVNALRQGRLRALMPVEGIAERGQFTHLEAMGRLLSGMAPWVESGGGAVIYGEKLRGAIAMAVDPQSPDYMNFQHGLQPVVDAAYFAHALLRAPETLWENLPAAVKRQVLDALRCTRQMKPWRNNWLLFSAIIEAFFARIGEEWDPMRIDYALCQHDEEYAGDGVYNDGDGFRLDYYNSFVIHPMMLAVLEAVSVRTKDWEPLRERVLERAQRYAAIQERLISPEGTFPPMGRSLTYRMGAFHHLGDMALQHQLPEDLNPAQVRCAMTAVIRRLMSAPGTFDGDGWLTIGFAGHQPALGDSYVSTGSTYLCSLAFLPLGLPPEDPFWALPPAAWTQKRIWQGEDAGLDRPLRG